MSLGRGSAAAHANISSPPPHLADGPSTFPLGAPDWLRNFWRWSFAADAASVAMAEFHGALLAAGGCDEDDLRRWSEELQQRATLEGGSNLLAAFHVGVSESLVLGCCRRCWRRPAAVQGWFPSPA